MLARGGRTSGSCARRCSTSASREWSRCPTSCTRSAAALRARGVDCALEPSGRGLRVRVRARRRSSPPARRRASRCASSCRRCDVLSSDARARALFLYPAKALAQDQARSLHALGVKRARPAIYDGDTPREQRADAAPARQRRADQPGHAAPRDPPEPPGVGGLLQGPRGRRDRRGARLPRRLRLARGQRAAAAAAGVRDLRHSPRFLLASATVANPGELASRLTGLDDVKVISRDGSPGTERTIAMWNPPVTDEATMARARRWPRPRTCSPPRRSRARGRSSS